MTKKQPPPIRLIHVEDCKVGDWVHNTTADCALHGYWQRCIGVWIGENKIDIWLEMDAFEETDLYHIEPEDTIVVCDVDPRPATVKPKWQQPRPDPPK